MATTSNGPAFWDSLLGPKQGKYPEYVSPDIFLGEYVALLEQDNSSDSNGRNSATGQSPSCCPIILTISKREPLRSFRKAFNQSCSSCKANDSESARADRIKPTPAEKPSSPSEGGAPTPKKLPRWKRRTPEQIEANKAAQKRFR